jgi:5-hydroxyisourate hydrolase
MTGYLTTHVLDTANGTPAPGLRIVLFRLTDAERKKVADKTTNEDGRTESPILPSDAFETGEYELVFHAGDYLKGQGMTDSFLDIVPLRFRMSEATHYHVPLLLSPFSYSTYRGS